MELGPAAVGTFDLVLLLGVLYHLRDPITALERVAAFVMEMDRRLGGTGSVRKWWLTTSSTLPPSKTWCPVMR